MKYEVRQRTPAGEMSVIYRSNDVESAARLKSTMENNATRVKYFLFNVVGEK